LVVIVMTPAVVVLMTRKSNADPTLELLRKASRSDASGSV